MSNPGPQSYVCFGGPLLYPAASWGVFFSNIPFTFSFAKVVFLLWYFYGITIGFLWDSYGNDVSMIYLEDFYGISEDAMGNSMVLLLDS